MDTFFQFSAAVQRILGYFFAKRQIKTIIGRVGSRLLIDELQLATFRQDKLAEKCYRIACERTPQHRNLHRIATRHRTASERRWRIGLALRQIRRATRFMG